METKQIVVTGDVALDTNIYKGIRKSPEVKDYGTLIKRSNGGSYLLFEIISQALIRRIPVIDALIKKVEEEKEKSKDNPKILKKSDEEIQRLNKEKGTIELLNKEKPISCQYGLKKDIFNKNRFPSFLETYALWDLIEFAAPKTYQKVCGEKTKAWRVNEMIGWGQEKKEEDKKDDRGKSEATQDTLFAYGNYITQEKYNPDILVFDDGGNNFRNDEKAWNNLLYENSKNEEEKKPRNIAQVILKTAYPLGHGNLFRILTKDFTKYLTIVTSINEIRKEDVLISKGVSWEQTALDLVSELRNNEAIKQLLNCKRLIVCFQSEGALYIEMGDKNEILKCRLIFDPEHLEGDWAKAGKIEGEVFGLMVCFTAALTYGIQEAFSKGNIDKAINLEATVTRGLSAMRRYKIVGHGKDKNNPDFPIESVCSEIVLPNSQFASAFVPIPVENQSTTDYIKQNWTILEGNYRPAKNENSEPLFDTAFRFALFGNSELANTPFLKVNNLITYDRCEIEALHNIKNLISDYLNEEKPEKPLSLAVFGMPGSGKSFAVKQLARALSLPILEFNLSQFADGDLEGALHQVRDKVLEGNPPVVFWDEFDSQAYKWLQYLLAPMQDGKFQAGQIIHPIGKSIFIFAGGTSFTFKSFGIEKPEEPNPEDILGLKNYEIILNGYNDFILKKGPDFKSRLSGYLDIQGPNQLEKLDDAGKIMKDDKGDVVYNEEDIQYPVRRALFIRGLCGRKNNDELIIDHGLLHALIKTRKFTHGSRSLEKILSYLKTKNSNKLQRSNLPTVSVLNMMVDKDFIGLLDVDKFFEFQAFKIAPQIHSNWMKIGDKQGWKLEYHKDYNYLPSHMKDENIAAARRIHKIIGIIKDDIKLAIVVKEEVGFFKNVDFPGLLKRNNYLEQFAIQEHKGWVETKEKMGWRYNEIRNDDRKLHNCIVEWDLEKQNLLPDSEKDKDKTSIICYHDVLAKAGFEIVELNFEKRS